LRFSISQHSPYGATQRLFIIKKLRKFFGGGYVMSYKTRPLCEFIVTKIDLIVETIIPFFEKHPIAGSKHLYFLDFKKASIIIKNKEHLSKPGLENILQLKKIFHCFFSKEFYYK
jgi:hypothetical protein